MRKDDSVSTLQNEKYLFIEATEENAWKEGQIIFEGLGESATGLAKEAPLVAIPGLLALVQEVPFVGPVAGILSGFFERYQSLSNNKEAFKDLGEEFKLVDVLFKDERLRNLMKNSQPDPTLENYLKQFTKRVYEIDSLIKAILDRIPLKGVMANAKNFIVADKDQERIKAALDASFKIRIGIQSYLARKPGLDGNSNKGMLSKVNVLLSKPTTFDLIAQEHQTKFREGSRSWLLDEVDAWFDDREILSTPSPPFNVGIASSNIKKESKSVFLLQAGAGMGKTVFASELVRRFKAKTPEVLLGVVFFNFKEVSTQGPKNLLKSIVYQIAQSNPSILNELLELLDETNDETTVEGIFDRILVRSLELIATKQKKYLIIFDALDESGLEGSSTRRELMQLFEQQFLLKLPAGVKLFVTCRPEKDIERTLNDFSHKIEDRDPRHLEDLKDYILFKMQEIFDDLKAVGNAASAPISIQQAADLIFDKSDGKFICTALIMVEMESWYRKDVSWADFCCQLLNLPKGLDDCYEKAFNKFIGSNQEYACSFLLLMVGCKELLTQRTVKDLLGIHSQHKTLFTNLVESSVTLFPLVGGEENVARFVPFHKSIVDWLTEEDRKRSPSYFDLEVASSFMADRLMNHLRISLRGKKVDVNDFPTATQTLEHLEIPINLSIGQEPTVLYAVWHLTHHLNMCQLGLVTYFLMTNLTWLQLS
eukprot:CAMPEP_0170106636 /NCGR_PEP_ID=MMETSP0020_2-20130122/5505_1 /TAXON_ID=98059 /ORGANISM="Dinobryon sp., Strain UTEXLB2267" /LENGTH=707 /DNA_ID=CAMNT_0010331027 /DNA_START=156 /DNA_END=2275 /DNA_ORIENTATION=-